MKAVNTWGDILALNWWVNLRSKVGWWVSIGVSIWATAITVPSLEERSVPAAMAMCFVLFVTFMAAIYLIAGVGIVVVATVNLFRKGCIGPKTFTIANDAFAEDDGRVVTTVPWGKIRSIDKTRGHIFVRVSRWKYMLLSARDFEHEYQFAQYYADLVKARHEGVT